MIFSSLRTDWRGCGKQCQTVTRYRNARSTKPSSSSSRMPPTQTSQNPLNPPVSSLPGTLPPSSPTSETGAPPSHPTSPPSDPTSTPSRTGYHGALRLKSVQKRIKRLSPHFASAVPVQCHCLGYAFTGRGWLIR